MFAQKLRIRRDYKIEIEYIFLSSFLAFMGGRLFKSIVAFGNLPINQLLKSTNLLEINPFSEILLC